MYFIGAVTKLQPVAVILSSQYPCSEVRCAPHYCIDNITKVSHQYYNKPDLCHTGSHPAPWLAIDFGEEAQVSVEKVVLFNRNSSKNYENDRLRNVEVRLTDELPTTANEKFSKGHLLGSFEGPATAGQEVEIKAKPGWDQKTGRYVVVQIDHVNKTSVHADSYDSETYLHLREVFTYGILRIPSNGELIWRYKYSLSLPPAE